MTEELKPNANSGVEFDKAVDSELDKLFGGEGTPAESSSAKETTADKTEPSKDAGADQHKTAEELEKEKEESAQKGKGLDDPNNLMFKKGYNEAKAKSDKEIAELRKGQLSKEEIDSFRNITSSPSYIRESMRAQGYKDEAIDAELEKRGHKVEPKETDDVALVTKALNMTDVTPEMKNYISDIAQVARIIAKDMLGREIPGRIKPLEEGLGRFNAKIESEEMASSMRKMVDSEGVLDFKKDVEPEMNKWLDEHEKDPESTLDDFKSYFDDFTRRLTVERLKLGKHREEQEKSKEANRSLKGGLSGKGRELPSLTGNLSKDIDAAMDALNIT